MRYWDTSALVALLLDESRSEAVATEHARDTRITTWWGTRLQCESALARCAREGATVDTGREVLDLLVASWREVSPSVELRRLAGRLCRVHPLRAADALQLAAALTLADGDPGSLPFVTFDERLAEAASKEGFPVLSPGI